MACSNSASPPAGRGAAAKLGLLRGRLFRCRRARRRVGRRFFRRRDALLRGLLRRCRAFERGLLGRGFFLREPAAAPSPLPRVGRRFLLGLPVCGGSLVLREFRRVRRFLRLRLARLGGVGHLLLLGLRAGARFGEFLLLGLVARLLRFGFRLARLLEREAAFFLAPASPSRARRPAASPPRAASASRRSSAAARHRPARRSSSRCRRWPGPRPRPRRAAPATSSCRRPRPAP